MVPGNLLPMHEKRLENSLSISVQSVEYPFTFGLFALHPAILAFLAYLYLASALACVALRGELQIGMQFALPVCAPHFLLPPCQLATQ